MIEAGITFKLGVKLDKVDDNKIYFEYEGTKEELVFDKLLVAIGRTPNTQGLGIENTSIKLGSKGEIIVNEKLETNVSNIWAIGDVYGGQQFTYTSLDDFRIIKSKLYGDGSYTLDKRKNVATSVFINPTLSNIGMTEKIAKAQNIDYRIFKMEASSIPKANILAQPKGLLKALVDPKTQAILGVTLYAKDSHEVINIITTAMNAGVSYTTIRDQIFTHPIMSEALNDLFADANEIK